MSLLPATPEEEFFPQTLYPVSQLIAQIAMAIMARRFTRFAIALPRRSLTNGATENDAKLIILRHGQSTWNAIPTFTGWCDAPLTQRGIAEARSSGNLFREQNCVFDAAFTSTLQRATITCELALESAESLHTPIHRAWQLNERH